MSTSGLTNQYIPPTLDGLTVVDADQIYIDGQLVDLTTLVPYTGADKPVDVGAQPIRTTYAPVATNDVVNLQALTDAVAYVDTSVALTYLSKISTVTQSVAGPVSFTNGVQTSTNKDVSLASTVIITPNYPNPTVYDGGVTAGSLFGTITNSGGTYQSTSTGDGGILVLGSGLSSGRVRLMINLLVNDTNGVAVSLFGSSDGVNPYQTIASHTFPPNTTTFWSSDTTFTLSYPYLILICNTASPGLGATVQWYGLTLYQMGVAMNNVTLPAQTGDRVIVLDASKRLVSSGINTTKLGYLDNVSSDIQTQLNSKASITYVDTGLAGKLNLSGSNANQNIVLGSFKVQSNATPTASTDYITKAYGDSTYALASALSGYVPYTGATTTLNMGANKITTTYTAVNNEDVVNKGSLTTALGAYLPLAGGTMTGDIIMNTRKIYYRGSDVEVTMGTSGSNSFKIDSFNLAGTAYQDMEHWFKQLYFVGNPISFANRASNPSKAQLIIQNNTNGERLLLGNYYTGGAGSGCFIQSSDFYTDSGATQNTDHGTDLLINPLGGYVGVKQSSPQWIIHASRTNAWDSSIGGYASNKALGILALGGKNDDPDYQYIIYPNPCITDGSIAGMAWWSSDMITGRYKNEFRIAWWKDTHGTPLGTSYKEGITMFLTDSGGYTNLDYIKFNGKTRMMNEIQIAGANVINFGYDVTKEANAGKIGYQVFGSLTNLDIVGAGTGTRKVKIYDSLGVSTDAGIYTLACGGTTYLSGKTFIGGTGGDGALNIYNAGYGYTHFSYPDGWNYIRGATTQFDSEVRLMTNPVTTTSTFNSDIQRLMFRDSGGYVREGTCSLWRSPGNQRAWTSGFRISNAFYKGIGSSVLVTISASWWATTVGLKSMEVYVYAPGTFLFVAGYSMDKYFNITGNHETITVPMVFNFNGMGYYDLYIIATGGGITSDVADVLWMTALTIG